MAEQTQISAYVAESTKKKLEAYAEAHGVKQAFLVEEALLHHLQALNELPADLLVPTRIVVSRASGALILDRVQNPPAPTRKLRDLMRKK